MTPGGILMRRTLLLTASAALLLAGCSSSTSHPAVASTSPAMTGIATSATPTAPAPSQAPTAVKKAGIGDTVALASTKAGNTLEVTLVKLVDPAPAADRNLAPRAGSRYVAVQLRITNKGADAYNQDTLSLVKAKDAAGETFTPDVVDTTAGQMLDPSLSLASGDTTLGVVVFQVPAGQKITRVQYTLSIRGGAVATWTVG